MRGPRRTLIAGLRIKLLGVLAAAAACAAGFACLVAPPPDQVVNTPAPTISIDQVQPAAGLIIDLPAGREFRVPVVVSDPTTVCTYGVYLDDALLQESNCDLTSLTAGSAPQFFSLPMTLDGQTCHRIVFSLGAASVTWTYVPSTCVVYDAGALQTGMFPAADANLVSDAEATQ